MASVNQTLIDNAIQASTNFAENPNKKNTLVMQKAHFALDENISKFTNEQLKQVNDILQKMDSQLREYEKKLKMIEAGLDRITGLSSKDQQSADDLYKQMLIESMPLVPTHKPQMKQPLSKELQEANALADLGDELYQTEKKVNKATNHKELKQAIQPLQKHVREVNPHLKNKAQENTTNTMSKLVDALAEKSFELSKKAAKKTLTEFKKHVANSIQDLKYEIEDTLSIVCKTISVIGKTCAKIASMGIKLVASAGKKLLENKKPVEGEPSPLHTNARSQQNKHELGESPEAHAQHSPKSQRR